MRAKPILPKSMEKRIWGLCRWCGTNILNASGEINEERLWHPACAAEYLIITRPRYARRAVARRDKKVCRLCKIKCNSTNTPWEADHIKPLWESKGRIEYFRLDNIRTLCVPCHAKVTKKGAARRARIKKKEKDKKTKVKKRTTSRKKKNSNKKRFPLL